MPCSDCTPKKSPEPSLSFVVGARGFMLRSGGYEYAPASYAPAFYAFDKIEDLAAWLVEQYGEGE